MMKFVEDRGRSQCSGSTGMIYVSICRRPINTTPPNPGKPKLSDPPTAFAMLLSVEADLKRNLYQVKEYS